MAKKNNAKRDTFIVFLVLLFFGCMMVVGYYWDGDTRYQEAYRPAVEESQRQRAADAPKSAEPRPRGFSERDIKKQEGRRYKTF